MSAQAVAMRLRAVSEEVSRMVPLLLLAVLPPGLRAQTQYFEVLPYRDPTQCERMQCLSVRLDYCLDHLEGFYRKEKGCPGEQICTDCVQGNRSTPTICNCENRPYAITVTYGQECNAGKVCAPGEGMCYRPCGTYLHSTLCPKGHCKWDPHAEACIDRPALATITPWKEADYSDSVYLQAEGFVNETQSAVFPVDFKSFKAAAYGYEIKNVLLENITELETLFVQLDNDNDGVLVKGEYAGLPNVLASIEQIVMSQLANAPSENTTDSSAEVTDGNRRLQSNYSGFNPSPETCGATRPRSYYCSFDQSCKQNCRECGWKSATDETFSTCVRPTPERCKAQGPPPGMVYCKSDDSCHPAGDCSGCVDRPIVDHSQSVCLELWWDPSPLTRWTSWVCRYRRKNGMPCKHDQDCIYGLRRCINEVCQPKQPYNANHTCDDDFDCPHLNYYCPKDPTGGENVYWIQYCRMQREEGQTCDEDRECMPQLRCNKAEAQPRCRRLFSLPIGALAVQDTLCELGWKGKDEKCALPAKSKECGRSCDSDRQCITTDQTGRTGNCVCKAWWEKDEAKYCEPVAGDYENHQEALRDYEYFRATQCGSFWTEEECLEIKGDEALQLKLRIECERQTLSQGPYLPPEDCNIKNEELYPDPCKRLESLR